MIIAFIGLDGSGKSTHSSLTYKFLLKKGLKVKTMHMINLSPFNKLLRFFKGENKKYLSSKKASLGKEYNKFHQVLGRSFLFVVDLFVYHVYHIFNKKNIVFDRYFHDKLSNFNSRNVFVKVYSKIFLSILPSSDIVFFLDVPLSVAYKRKPEYTKKFFAQKYDSYQFLSKDTIVIKPTTIKDTQEKIEKILSKKLE